MSLPIRNSIGHRSVGALPLVGALTLQRGRLHEACGPARLVLAVMAMAGSIGPVVWIRPGWWPERVNPAGLQPMADPARLLLVRADREEAALWAGEEALRSGAAPLVVVEAATPPGLTPVRRLHLAAEAGVAAAGRDGGMAPLGLLLTPGQGGAPGVETRWHLTPAPSQSLLWSEVTEWTLTRLRARLAPPAAWRVTRDGQGRHEARPLPAPDPFDPESGAGPTPHTTR